MCLDDYALNVIWSNLTKSRNSANLIIGIEACYKVLDEADITLTIHQLDNEISDTYICVIKKKEIKIKLLLLITIDSYLSSTPF